MKQIRTGVFETNSSLTHSIVMCPTAGYNEWAYKETMLFNEYLKPKFVTIEEGRKYNADVMRKWRDEIKDGCFDYGEEDAIEALTDENIEKYIAGEFDFESFCLDSYSVDEYMYYTFDYWNEYICMYRETFESHYEENGVKVTAFGYYGHD